MSNIFLLSGGDKTLLAQKVKEVVDKCVGDKSSELVLTKFEESDYEIENSISIDPVVAAANTESMYEPFRVIEARNLGLFSTQDDLDKLYKYLEVALDTTYLILVWEKGMKQARLSPLPKQLKESVIVAGGEYISASKPVGAKVTKEWFQEKINSSGLNLDSKAQVLLQNHLGSDVGRLQSILEILSSALSNKTGNLSAEDISPFLGKEGSIPTWELTAALAKGDGTGSLYCLKRQLDSGEHPIAILYFLINHYSRIARLDGAGFTNSADVAKELKMSAYPAKLALEESKKLGFIKIKRIMEMLGKADEDLKGGTGLDQELVLEILIARIAQQYRLKTQVA